MSSVNEHPESLLPITFVITVTLQSVHGVYSAGEVPEPLLARTVSLDVGTRFLEHLYFKETELWIEPKSFPGLPRLHE